MPNEITLPELSTKKNKDNTPKDVIDIIKQNAEDAGYDISDSFRDDMRDPEKRKKAYERLAADKDFKFNIGTLEDWNNAFTEAYKKETIDKYQKWSGMFRLSKPSLDRFGGKEPSAKPAPKTTPKTVSAPKTTPTPVVPSEPVRGALTEPSTVKGLTGKESIVPSLSDVKPPYKGVAEVEESDPLWYEKPFNPENPMSANNQQAIDYYAQQYQDYWKNKLDGKGVGAFPDFDNVVNTINTNTPGDNQEAVNSYVLQKEYEASDNIIRYIVDKYKDEIPDNPYLDVNETTSPHLFAALNEFVNPEGYTRDKKDADAILQTAYGYINQQRQVNNLSSLSPLQMAEIVKGEKIDPNDMPVWDFDTNRWKGNTPVGQFRAEDMNKQAAVDAYNDQKIKSIADEAIRNLQTKKINDVVLGGKGNISDTEMTPDDFYEAIFSDDVVSKLQHKWFSKIDKNDPSKSTFSQEVIREAQKQGMLPGEFVERSMRSYLGRMEKYLDKVLEDKYAVKNTMDYLIKNFETNTLTGQIYMAMAGKGRTSKHGLGTEASYLSDELAKSELGQGKYYKPSTLTKIGGIATTFTDPAFAAAGGIVTKTAGGLAKVVGTADKVSTRVNHALRAIEGNQGYLATLTKSQRLLQGTAGRMVQSGTMLGLYSGATTGAQLYNNGERGMGLYNGVMDSMSSSFKTGALFPLMELPGQKLLGKAIGKTSWQRGATMKEKAGKVLKRFGYGTLGMFVSTGVFNTVDASVAFIEGNKDFSFIENIPHSFEMAMASKVANPKGLVGTMVNYFRSNVKHNDINFTQKEKQEVYNYLGVKDAGDISVNDWIKAAEARQDISLATRQKIMLAIGHMCYAANPRTYKYNIVGTSDKGVLEERTKEGDLISRHEYNSQDELDKITNEVKNRQTLFDTKSNIGNALGFSVDDEGFTGTFGDIAAEVAERNGYKGTNDRNDRRILERMRTVGTKEYQDYTGTVFRKIASDFAQNFGIKVEDIQKILDKKPEEWTPDERTIMSEFGRAYADAVPRKGILSTDHEETSGASIADSVGAGTVDEDPQAVSEASKELSQRVEDAKAVWEQYSHTSDGEAVAGQMDAYQKQGVEPLSDDMYNLLSQKFTEEQLAPLADLINAQTRQRAFLDKTSTNIDEQVSRVAQNVTFRGSATDADGNPIENSVIYVVSGGYRYVLTGGDVTIDKDGRLVPKEGCANTVTLRRVDENGILADGEGLYIRRADELYVEKTEPLEDMANRLREQIGQATTGNIASAAQDVTPAEGEQQSGTEEQPEGGHPEGKTEKRFSVNEDAITNAKPEDIPDYDIRTEYGRSAEVLKQNAQEAVDYLNGDISAADYLGGFYKDKSPEEQKKLADEQANAWMAFISDASKVAPKGKTGEPAQEEGMTPRKAEQTLKEWSQQVGKNEEAVKNGTFQMGDPEARKNTIAEVEKMFNEMSDDDPQKENMSRTLNGLIKVDEILTKQEANNNDDLPFDKPQGPKGEAPQLPGGVKIPRDDKGNGVYHKMKPTKENLDASIDDIRQRADLSSVGIKGNNDPNTFADRKIRQADKELDELQKKYKKDIDEVQNGDASDEVIDEAQEYMQRLQDGTLDEFNPKTKYGKYLKASEDANARKVFYNELKNRLLARTNEVRVEDLEKASKEWAQRVGEVDEAVSEGTYTKEDALKAQAERRAFIDRAQKMYDSMPDGEAKAEFGRQLEGVKKLDKKITESEAGIKPVFSFDEGDMVKDSTGDVYKITGINEEDGTYKAVDRQGNKIELDIDGLERYEAPKIDFEEGDTLQDKNGNVYTFVRDNGDGTVRMKDKAGNVLSMDTEDALSLKKYEAPKGFDWQSLSAEKLSDDIIKSAEENWKKAVDFFKERTNATRDDLMRHLKIGLNQAKLLYKRWKAEHPTSTPAEKFQKAKKLKVEDGAIYMPDGSKIEGTYYIVPAMSVTPSHDPFNGYKTSEGFPTSKDGSNVNDRDYEHSTSNQRATDDMANDYDGRAIQDVPVVSDEGIVYSGNGRTMAGQLAAKRGKDGKYLAALKERVKGKVSPEEVDKIENARLVFVPKERLPYTTDVFSKFNDPTMKAKSDLEKAIAIGKSLKEEDKVTIAQELAKAKNIDAFFDSKERVSSLLDKLVKMKAITQNQATGMTDDNGHITDEGEKMITNILLGTAFNRETIEKVFDKPIIKRKMIQAMKPIMENRQMGQYKLENHIKEAVDLVHQAYATGKGGTRLYKSVEAFLRTGSLDGGWNRDHFSPMAQELAKRLDGRVDDLRKFIDDFNKIAKPYTSDELSVFDYRPSLEEVIKRHLENQNPFKIVYRQLVEKMKMAGIKIHDIKEEGQKVLDAAQGDGESSLKFSLRKKEAPKKTQKVYKLMRLGADGKLYPLFIDSSEPVELGKWYDADSPDLSFIREIPSEGAWLVDPKTHTYTSLRDYNKSIGRLGGKNPRREDIEKATANGQRWIYVEDKAKGQARYGGEHRAYYNYGLADGKPKHDFAMRPGWHAGSLPTMRQIGKGSKKNLRDDHFVWVEGEVSADNDYNKEAQGNPMKDIPEHIPTDGYYLKSTNANSKAAQADRVGWYVAGAFKANRIISDAEARKVIDDWNATHQDKKVEYDWKRESGEDFDGNVEEYTKKLYQKQKNAQNLISVANRSKETKELADKNNVKFFKTSDGEVYGFVDLKTKEMYLDPDHMDANVPIHEYGHLWLDGIRRSDKKTYDNIIKLIDEKDESLKPIFDEVRKDEPGLEGEDLKEEVLMRYSGKRGEERLNQKVREIQASDRTLEAKDVAIGAIDKVRLAIHTFWKKVADKLGIPYKDVSEVADHLLGDLLEGRNPNEKKAPESPKSKEPVIRDIQEKADKFNEANEKLMQSIEEGKDANSTGEEWKAFRKAKNELRNAFREIDPTRLSDLVAGKKQEDWFSNLNRGSREVAEDVNSENKYKVEVDKAFEERKKESEKITPVEPKKKKIKPIDFIIKDVLRPIFGGVFHDSGYVIGTSGHMLFASKEEYDKKLEGKVTDKKGNEIKGTFPDWRTVIPKKEELKASGVDINALHRFVTGVLAIKGADKNVLISFKDSDGNVRTYKAVELDKILRVAKQIGGDLYVTTDSEQGRPLVAMSDKGVAILSPFLSSPENIRNYSYVFAGKPKDKPVVEDTETQLQRTKTEQAMMRVDPSGRMSDDMKDSEGEPRAVVLQKVAEVSDSLNLGGKKTISIEYTTDNIPDNVKDAISRGKAVVGWYDPKDGSTHLYMPNVHDSYTAEKTILHEVVGHKGLRELLGDKGYRDFMRKLYIDNVGGVADYVKENAYKYGYDLYKTIDEYLAEQAEKFGGEDRSLVNRVWDKITDVFNAALEKLGFSTKLTNRDVKRVLWESRNRIKEDDPEDSIKHNAFLDRLRRTDESVDVFEGQSYDESIKRDKNGYLSTDAMMKASSTKPSEDDTMSQQSIREMYEARLHRMAYVWTEAHSDYMQSMREMMRAYLGKKVKIEDVPGYENPIFAENQVDSKLDIMAKNFERNYARPLEKVVAKAMAAFPATGLTSRNRQRRRQLQVYLIRKHGLERNRTFFVRDFLNKERRKKITDKDLLTNEKQEFDKRMVQAKTDLQNKKIDQSRYDFIANRTAQQIRRESMDALQKKYDNERARLKALYLSGGKRQYDLYYKDLDDWINLNINSYDAGENDYSGFRGMERKKYTESYDDAAEIATLMQEEAMLESHKPGIVDELYEQLNKISRFSLDTEYNAGLITKGAYERAKTMFDWYVPLRGFEGGVAEDHIDYFQERGQKDFSGPALMKAIGRKSAADLEGPLATLCSQASTSMQRAVRNGVKQTFGRFIDNHYEKDNPNRLVTKINTWIVKKTIGGKDVWEEEFPPIDENTPTDQIQSILDKWNKDMWQLAEQGDAFHNTNQEHIPYKFRNRTDKDSHFVTVFNNGIKELYVINGHPRAAQAINGELRSDDKTNAFEDFIRAIQNVQKRLVTTYSPDFIGSNLSRDANQGGTYIFAKEGLNYYRKYFGAWWKAFAGKMTFNVFYRRYKKGTLNPNSKDDMYFKEFADNGGMTGFYTSQTVDDWKKELNNAVFLLSGKTGKTVKALKDFNPLTLVIKSIDLINKNIENITRFTTYKVSREMGRSIARSINDAKTVSTNFNTRGSYGKVRTFDPKATGIRKANQKIAGGTAQIARLFSPFYNASVQSMKNLYRMVKEHPVRSGVVLGGHFMLGAVAPIMNAWLQALLDDDDDTITYKGQKVDYYAQLPDWKRRQNLCIYMGHGHFLTLPIGIENRAFFGMGDLAASAISSLLDDWIPGEYVKAGQRLNDPTEDKGLSAVGLISQMFPLDWVGAAHGTGIESNLIPMQIQPLYEIKVNTDWKGQPIMQDREHGDMRPNWQLANRDTGQAYIDLAKKIEAMGNDYHNPNIRLESNILETLNNPAAWEHVIKGETGGFGQTINEFAELYKEIQAEPAHRKTSDIVKDVILSSNMPVLRRFNAKSNFGEARQEYYSFKEIADKAKATKKALEEDGKTNPESKIQSVNFDKTPKAKIAAVYDFYQKYVSDLSKKINSTNDPQLRQQLMDQRGQVMYMAVEDMRQIK